MPPVIARAHGKPAWAFWLRAEVVLGGAVGFAAEPGQADPAGSPTSPVEAVQVEPAEAEASEPLTSLREKLIKIGARIVSDGRYVTFRMAQITVSRQRFQEIVSLIRPAAGTARASMRADGSKCGKRRR